jgi:hypothetical protein
MPISLRRFNEKGTAKFQSLLMQRDLDPHDQSTLFLGIREILNASEFTTLLHIDIEIVPFSRRRDLAKHLWTSIGESEVANQNLVGDPDMWNWISAAWLETLVTNHDGVSCPECQKNSQDLSRLIGDFKRWVLIENSRRYHWHLLSHPFFVYQANLSNPGSAEAFLATDVLHPGDLVDKIASNRRFIGEPVSDLATLLYFDKSRDSLRPGRSNRLGEVNQLSRFLNQIDRTIDFEGMEANDLIELLPENFKEWVAYAKNELSNRGQSAN